MALAAALAPAVAARRRAVGATRLPLAVAAARLVGALSLGGLVWIGPLLLALVVIASGASAARRTLALALPFALLLGVLAIPAVSEGLLPPSAKPLVGPNGAGNLHRPAQPGAGCSASGRPGTSASTRNR